MFGLPACNLGLDMCMFGFKPPIFAIYINVYSGMHVFS